MRLISRCISRLFTVLLIGMLVACAMPSTIKPGEATADELLKRLGKPTSTRPDPQGGEFWEYVYGPEGTQTWLFGVDRNRVVRSSTQLLTQERLQRVVPGVTTEAQVRDLLGDPREVVRFREETAWEWRVDLPPSKGLFVVRFNDQKLATGFNVLVDPGSDSDDKDAGSP